MDVAYYSIGVLIIDTLLICTLLFAMFRLRSHFGMVPLYITLGVFQPIQTILASSVYIEIFSGILVSPGSVVMFTASLMAILMIYICEDASETRKVIYGIIIANVIVSILFYVSGLHLENIGPSDFISIPKELLYQNSRVIFVGSIMLFIDAILIIVIYELVCKLYKFAHVPKKFLFLRFFITLSLVLSIDTLGFCTGAFYGEDNYIELLISGIIGKVIFSILFSIFASVYFKFFEPVVDSGYKIKDVFHILTYRQKYEIEKDSLRVSEQGLKLFKSVVEFSTDAIGMSNAEGKHWYQNNAFTDLYGEIGSDPPSTVYADEKLGREIFKTILSGEVWTGEVQLRQQNGNIVDTFLRAYPVKDKSGKVECVIGLHTDITEKKKEFAEKLLLEEKMLHTQKLESLGLLSSSIAHDFNNLLTAIVGYTELALFDVPKESSVASNLELIKVSSKHAEDLTKQMLSYSGKGSLKIELIDLEKLISNMMNLLNIVIPKQATIEYNFAENLPMFNGDVSRINQIIMNIITNAADAIKSTNENGKITLNTGSLMCNTACDDVCVYSNGMPLCFAPDELLKECSDYKGLCVYFEVIDTGCGMSSEDAKKIFDPFYTTKTTGRGLGMSAVLNILKQHKGILRVYSEVSKGTKLSVFFPVELQRKNI